MRTRQIIPLIFTTSWVAASMLGVLTAPVFAGSPASDGADLLNPAESDVVTYASMLSVTQSEAERRLDLQDRAGRLESILSAELPDAFGGMWVRHQPEFRVIVYLTSGDMSTIRGYVASGDLEAILEIEHVERPRAQLQSDADLLAEGMPGDIAIRVLVPENVVEVMGPSAQEFARHLEKVGISMPESARFVAGQSRGAAAADIYGGLPLNGNISCTSGFSVKKNGESTTGVLTAGHCSDGLTYSGQALHFEGGTYGGSHDEQWHSSLAFFERNWFRVNANGATRTVTSRTNRTDTPDGGYICKFGRTTAYGCGFLVTKSFRPDWVPDALATFMQVHGSNVDLSSGGDSGGPVFLTNSAYGIVEGWYGNPDGTLSDLIYTAINYPESFLGVTVLTN
ncbi:MAG TPA: S1 family peptidase [Candidatus Limnocylindrales bacterium]|jgi:hypothetical protein|nr:S1 family peptidase [Candidatus Limnocylindrales bacterium]